MTAEDFRSAVECAVRLVERHHPFAPETAPALDLLANQERRAHAFVAFLSGAVQNADPDLSALIHSVTRKS